MKSSLNQEKLEEIKDPAPGRKEYYDKSKGEITPLNQNAGDILAGIQGGNSNFQSAVEASLGARQKIPTNTTAERAAARSSVGQSQNTLASLAGGIAGSSPQGAQQMSNDSSELEGRIAALEQGNGSNDIGSFKPKDVLAAGARFGQQQIPGTFDRSLNS